MLHLDPHEPISLAVLSASGALALLNLELHWIENKKPPPSAPARLAVPTSWGAGGRPGKLGPVLAVVRETLGIRGWGPNQGH